MKIDGFMRAVKAEREARGWGQRELARRLNVSQPYVVMLEKGRRTPTPELRRKLMEVCQLSPSLLPLTKSFVVAEKNPQMLAEALGALGYPGYAYLSSPAEMSNPAEVLLTTLAHDNLEPRLLEALPWLVLRYWDMDFDGVTEQAKKLDLQNRLGFVVNVARRMSERLSDNETRTQKLLRVEARLERSRLAREDDFPRPNRSKAERAWLLNNRPEEAKHWNLVTDLKPDQLKYGYA